MYHFQALPRDLLGGGEGGGEGVGRREKKKQRAAPTRGTRTVGFGCHPVCGIGGNPAESACRRPDGVRRSAAASATTGVGTPGPRDIFRELAIRPRIERNMASSYHLPAASGSFEAFREGRVSCPPKKGGERGRKASSLLLPARQPRKQNALSSRVPWRPTRTPVPEVNE